MRAVPRRRGARLARGLVVLAVVAAPSGCGGLPPPAPAVPTTVAAAGADGVRDVRFDHRSGTAPSPAPVVVVPAGSTVELVVGSDVAERVTLRGYGWSRYVTAGATVTLRFVVDGPEELVVTAGEPGVELGRLQVRR